MDQFLSFLKGLGQALFFMIVVLPCMMLGYVVGLVVWGWWSGFDEARQEFRGYRTEQEQRRQKGRGQSGDGED